MARSAVSTVFNTTELLEMILLTENVRMQKLFVLQRVNKKFQDVIEGSPLLRIKMFVDYSSVGATKIPADPGGLKHFMNTLTNPITGPIRTSSHIFVRGLSRHSGTLAQEGAGRSFDAALELLPFRHFDFNLGTDDSGLYVSSSTLRYGAVEKKLEPRLAGSWRRLKITRVPAKLEFRHIRLVIRRDGDPSDTVFEADEHTTMGDLADWLAKWYHIRYLEYKQNHSLSGQFFLKADIHII